MDWPKEYEFDPAAHEPQLVALLEDLATQPVLSPRRLDRLVRRHPRPAGGFYKKTEIVRGLRWLARRGGPLTLAPEELTARLRMKPVRTLSGVAPVTVLTRPHPCPGRCIFCPDDVRAPKSYLADEPGVQRAITHRYDPYRQTWARLAALCHMGHPVSKVELIVLGGTWSSYPLPYRRWFVLNCLTALSAFDPGLAEEPPPEPPAAGAATEEAGWDELAAAQRDNEAARVRMVGLVLETRPDHVTPREVLRLRRLGATRVQIGYQSLSDEVLAANRRGHDVAAARRASGLLRRAGFKILAHWMPNLYGSTPSADVEDFARIFDDSGLRPDELKIYPCSLVETAELMEHWRDGRWRPYEEAELLDVLTRVMPMTPAWCRLTRVVRDIPGGDIVTGNKTTNLREVAEAELARRGVRLAEIRSREIRGRPVERREVRFGEYAYDTDVSSERFLEALAGDGRLAGFLRLSLPRPSMEEIPGLEELAGAAIIREVHVYGALVDVGEREAGRSQHRGLGRELVERAAAIARGQGYPRLAVISSVGTRRYYRRLGFVDGELYQHREL